MPRGFSSQAAVISCHHSAAIKLPAVRAQESNCGRYGIKTSNKRFNSTNHQPTRPGHTVVSSNVPFDKSRPNKQSSTKAARQQRAIQCSVARHQIRGRGSDLMQRFAKNFTTPQPFKPQILRTCYSPRLRYLRDYRAPLHTDPTFSELSLVSDLSRSDHNDSTSAESDAISESAEYETSAGTEQNMEKDQLYSSESSAGSDTDQEFGEDQGTSDDALDHSDLTGDHIDHGNGNEGDSSVLSRSEHQDSNGDSQETASDIPALSLTPVSLRNNKRSMMMIGIDKRRNDCMESKRHLGASSKDSAYNECFSNSSRGGSPDQPDIINRRARTSENLQRLRMNSARYPGRTSSKGNPDSGQSSLRTRAGSSEAPSDRFSDKRGALQEPIEQFRDWRPDSDYVHFLADVTSDMLNDGHLNFSSAVHYVKLNISRYHHSLNLRRMIEEASNILLKLELIDSDQAQHLSSQLLLESYTNSRVSRSRASDQSRETLTRDQPQEPRMVTGETNRYDVTLNKRSSRISGFRQRSQSDDSCQDPILTLPNSQREESETSQDNLNCKKGETSKRHTRNETPKLGNETPNFRADQSSPESGSVGATLTSPGPKRHVEKCHQSANQDIQEEIPDMQQGNRKGDSCESNHDQEIPENPSYSPSSETPEENRYITSPRSFLNQRSEVQQEVEELLQELDLDSEVVNTVVRCMEKRHAVINIHPRINDSTSQTYAKHRSTQSC